MKRYTFLLASLLASLGLWAQWVEPVPQGTTEVVPSVSQDNGTPYYLYDALHKGFYCSGNDSDTQGSWGEPTSDIFFIPVTVDGWDFHDAWILRNYVPVRNRWDDIFLSPTSGVLWNDCGGRDRPGNLWAMEWNGDKVSFYAVGPDSEQYIYREENMGYKVYIGYVEDGSTIYWPTNPKASEVPVEYKDNIQKAEFTLVTKPAYEAFKAEQTRYRAAVDLLAYIEKTGEAYPELDLSAARAVYADTASTLEQLQAARRSVAQAVLKLATADSPADVTGMLKSPNPDTATEFGWDVTGSMWLSTCDEVPDKVLESFQANFDMSQELTDMPDGLYRVDLKAFYRADGCTAPTQFYINDELFTIKSNIDDALPQGEAVNRENCYIDNVGNWPSDYVLNECYVPQSVAGACYAFRGGRYAQTFYCHVTGGRMKIGLKGPGNYWTIVRGIQLYYLGAGPDAAALWRDEMMGKYDAQNADAVARKSLTDAFAALKESADQTVTFEDASALVARADSLTSAIQSSARAYAAFDAAVSQARTYIEEHDMNESEVLDSLDTYVNSDEEAGGMFPYGSHSTIMEELALDNEQLAAETARVNSLLARAMRASIEEGGDVTAFIKNASLDTHPDNDWTTTGNLDFGSRQNIAPDNVWGFWGPFDMHQTLVDMPNGVYKLQVQAFHNTQTSETNTVELYINEYSNRVLDVNEDALPEADAVDMENCLITNSPNWPYDVAVNGAYIPTSWDGASFAFKGGRYENALYAVVTDGTLCLGIRDKVGAGGAWTCFRNFRLTYLGEGAEACDSMFAALRAQLDGYAAAETKYYKGHSDSALACIEAGEAAEDGAAKYAQLTQAAASVNAIPASAALYSELNSLLERSFKSYWDAAKDPETPAYQEAVHFEDSVYTPVVDKMLLGTLSDDEAEAWIETMKHDKYIDVVYVLGDVEGASDWLTNCGLYPLVRQADGTFEGDFKAQDLGADYWWCDRATFLFEYKGQQVRAANHPYFMSPGRNKGSLVIGDEGAGCFRTYGGDWHVKMDLEKMTVEFTPISEPPLPTVMYFVGNIVGDDWQLNKNHPLKHIGNGIYQGTVEIAEGTDRRLCIFGTNAIEQQTWNTESRWGTVNNMNDPINITRFGKPIKGLDRSYGDCAWQFDEPGTYTATVDLNACTITFDKEGDYEHVELNSYAYGMSARGADDGVHVTYSLSSPAKAAELRFKQGGETVYSRALQGHELSQGKHEVTVANDSLGVDGTELSYDIKVTSYGIEAGKSMLFGNSLRGNSEYGMAVNTVPSSPGFGTLYVPQGRSDQKSYSGMMNEEKHVAVFAFDPTFEPILGADGKEGFQGGIDMSVEPLVVASGYHMDFKDVCVSDDGRVFIARCSGTSNSPVWEANPADLNEPWRPVFTGGELDPETGITWMGDQEQSRCAVGLASNGTGDNLKLTVLGGARSDGGANFSDYTTMTYDLGSAQTWTGVPQEYTPLSGKYNLGTGHVRILGDKRGGIWFKQRLSPLPDGVPSVKHFNAQGEEDYTDIGHNNCWSAMAVSADGTHVAMATDNAKVAVYAVDYTPGPDGQITLTQELEIATKEQHQTAMAFDYANNLIVGATDSKSYSVSAYLIPSWTDNEITTPCPSPVTVVDEATAIRGPKAAGEAGAVYNVNGIRVEKASKGVFIINGKKVAVK